MAGKAQAVGCCNDIMDIMMLEDSITRSGQEEGMDLFWLVLVEIYLACGSDDLVAANSDRIFLRAHENPGPGS